MHAKFHSNKCRPSTFCRLLSVHFIYYKIVQEPKVPPFRAMVIGPLGSGKSTVAMHIQQTYPDIFIVKFDKLVMEMARHYAELTNKKFVIRQPFMNDKLPESKFYILRKNVF